jgi:hypothetical protein
MLFPVLYAPQSPSVLYPHKREMFWDFAIPWEQLWHYWMWQSLDIVVTAQKDGMTNQTNCYRHQTEKPLTFTWQQSLSLKEITQSILQKDWTGSNRHMLHLIHALVHHWLTKRRGGSTKDGHLFTENRIPEKNFGFQTKEKSLRELHMWGSFLPWLKKLLDLLVS